MTPNQTKLFEAANTVRKNAYAPYSKYHVGAALLTKTGDIITGCNVENAAYPVGMCAEFSAIGQAISRGFREFEALCVTTDSAGTPCGKCRQMIAEICGDIPIYIADGNGIKQTVTSYQLLPFAFLADNLK